MSLNVRSYKVCSRNHLLNMLEEEVLCRNCEYCNFLKILEEKLKANGFFSHSKSVNEWEIAKIPNGELIAVPKMTTDYFSYRSKKE